MYENDKVSFNEMTDLNLDSFKDMTSEMVYQMDTIMVPGFNGAIQSMIDTVRAEDGIVNVVSGAWEEIGKAAETYQKRVKTISDKSGEDLKNLQVNTNTVLQNLQGWVAENDTIIENAEASKNAYDTIAAGVKALAEQYDATKQNAKDAAAESTALQSALNSDTWKNLEAQMALDKLNTALKTWNDTEVKAKEFKTILTTESNGGGSGSSGSSGSSSGTGSTTQTPTATTSAGSTTTGSTTVKKAKWYLASADNKKTVSASMGPYNSEFEAKNNKKGAYTIPWAKYKTGGYTGVWPGGSIEDNGRLAMLHQKELVLNSRDTENFLEAIHELREMTNSMGVRGGSFQESVKQQMIETLHSGQFMREISSLMNNNKIGYYDNVINSMDRQMMENQNYNLDFQTQIIHGMESILASLENLNHTFEQSVSIQAEFNDVRSSQAIEDAFVNLTNKASQAAFNVLRKK